MTARSATALRTGVVGALVVACLLALVSTRRTWLRVSGVGVTGSDTTGGLVGSLALMLSISIVLLLVVATTGRRVVGVIQAGVGVGLVATVLTHRHGSAQLWLSKGVDPGAAVPTMTAWPWLCLAAGVLACVAGIALAATASRWPPRRPSHSSTGRSARDIWEAQDRGQDPTGEGSADDDAGRADT